MVDNREKLYLLLVTSLAGALVPFMVIAINVAFPAIGKDLHIGPEKMGWISLSATLAASITVIPAGRLGDMFGRKRIFLLGTAIGVLTSFALAASDSAFCLITFRLVQGVGAALIMNTSIAMLATTFPAGERGRAIGINQASVFLGQSLSPFLGGLVTQYLGWRYIFFIGVPLGLVIIGLTITRIKSEWVVGKSLSLDPVGSGIYACMVFALIYGSTKLMNTVGQMWLAAGFLFLVALIYYERRASQPIIRIDLFARSRIFSFSLISALIGYSSIFAITFVMSLYLQYIKGMSPQAAGILLVTQPLAQSVFSPFSGKLADRFQARTVASFGMALTAVGLILCTFLGRGTPYVLIIFSLFLVGAGMAFFISPNTNAIMGAVDKSLYGMASGTIATVRQIGMMLSVAISMLMFNIFLGDKTVTPADHPAVLKSVTFTFIIFAASCLIGIFTSYARGKTEQATG